MRAMLLLMSLFVSACATNSEQPISGNYTKNDGPVAVERLGTMTLDHGERAQQCGDNQVNWCARRFGRTKSCRCLYIREAEELARRVLGQHRAPDNY